MVASSELAATVCPGVSTIGELYAQVAYYGKEARYRGDQVGSFDPIRNAAGVAEGISWERRFLAVRFTVQRNLHQWPVLYNPSCGDLLEVPFWQISSPICPLVARSEVQAPLSLPAQLPLTMENGNSEHVLQKGVSPLPTVGPRISGVPEGNPVGTGKIPSRH